MSARSTDPLRLQRLPQRSWILRSKTRARVFAGLAGAVVIAGTSAAEWFFYEAGESPLVMMLASDIFAGLLVWLLISGVLVHLVERAESVRRQLEVIAEMNHHIRNALQLISFSAYSTHDQQTILRVRQGTERIEWALREILESGTLDAPPPRKPPESKKPPDAGLPPGQASA